MYGQGTWASEESSCLWPPVGEHVAVLGCVSDLSDQCSFCHIELQKIFRAFKHYIGFLLQSTTIRWLKTTHAYSFIVLHVTRPKSISLGQSKGVFKATLSPQAPGMNRFP